jgi:hypothetical protein
LGVNLLGSWKGGFCSKSEHNSRSIPAFHRVPERGAQFGDMRRHVDALRHPDFCAK